MKWLKKKKKSFDNRCRPRVELTGDIFGDRGYIGHTGVNVTVQNYRFLLCLHWRRRRTGLVFWDGINRFSTFFFFCRPPARLKNRRAARVKRNSWRACRPRIIRPAATRDTWPRPRTWWRVRGRSRSRPPPRTAKTRANSERSEHTRTHVRDDSVSLPFRGIIIFIVFVDVPVPIPDVPVQCVYRMIFRLRRPSFCGANDFFFLVILIFSLFKHAIKTITFLEQAYNSFRFILLWIISNEKTL